MIPLFDPLVRGPLFGSILMSLAASMMGTFLFVRKKTLIGETLSHATYPGVVLGAFLAAFLGFEKTSPLWIMGGGLLFAFLGALTFSFLQNKVKMASDSALSIVLTSFFGLGILCASVMQSFYPKELRRVQSYLFGHVATMTDFHILLYGLLALGIFALISLFYKELKIVSFDPIFLSTLGKSSKTIETLFLFLVVLSTVIGIRCVGVVLMSAMLIAPPIAARQWCRSLFSMIIFAAFFAMVSSFLGTLLSLKMAFSTGPTIVAIASFFAGFSLLFAPQRGLLARGFRIFFFRVTTVSENLLKLLWRDKKLSFNAIKEQIGGSRVRVWIFLILFRIKGLVKKQEGRYVVTQKGLTSGNRIVRLHRLWEVYLVQYLGMGAERVHKSAEEMEHILTSELERELTFLLKDPKNDPHNQPIPQIHG